MLNDIFSRTEQLLGPERLHRLHDSHVLVVGLGGVGGYAAEMLGRSGVGTMTIVDADVVVRSNINRQLIATHSTIGQPKAELWAERLRSIHPDMHIHVVDSFIKDDITESMLTSASYDFAIDAIDTLSPKVNLIKSLCNHQIPFVSAMGAGAKADPTLVRIGTMKSTKNCTLARFIRKRLRKLGVPLDFSVVYSEELPDPDAIREVSNEQNKKSTAGTIAMVPAISGIYCAHVAIQHLLTHHA